MTGLSNYTANNLLNWLAGGIVEPALPSVWVALFTAVGTDAGTGFTEVSGGSYARIQIAGSNTTSGSTAAANSWLHFSATPSWIQPGMEIYNANASNLLAITSGTTVSSVNSTVVIMSASVPASNTVNSGDSIVFTAFGQPTGTAPATMTNVSTITFPQATLNWGTVIAFGLYDAVTSGNLLLWDFLGNYSWLPFTASSVGSGAGGVFTSKAHGYSAGDPVVVTSEYGGTLPTASQGTLISYTVNYCNTVTTDTFTLSANSILADQGTGNAVWTSSTGDGSDRKIVMQSIPQNVTASFSNSTLTTSAA